MHIAAHNGGTDVKRIHQRAVRHDEARHRLPWADQAKTGLLLASLCASQMLSAQPHLMGAHRSSAATPLIIRADYGQRSSAPEGALAG